MRFFELLRTANMMRQDEVFSHCKNWTSGQLACAVAGEVGELCNLVKKEFRGEPNQFDIASVASEIADVAIYLDLLAEKHGVVFDASCTEYDKTLTLGDNVLLLILCTGRLAGVFAAERTGIAEYVPKHDVFECINEASRLVMKALFGIAAKYGILPTVAIVEKFNHVSFMRRSRIFLGHENLEPPNVEHSIIRCVSDLSKNITLSFNALASLVGEDDSLANVLLCSAGIAAKLSEPVEQDDFASMAYAAYESMSEAQKLVDGEKKRQSEAN